MEKWSGSASGTVAVPADEVWKIANFGELEKWDPKIIQSCCLEQGDGCSSGSIRRVVFNYPNGSTGLLIERMTSYDAEKYTYCYDMDENPLGYKGYRCTLSLENHGNETTTVSYSFKLDAMQEYSKDAVVGGMEAVHRRRIALLKDVAKSSANS